MLAIYGSLNALLANSMSTFLALGKPYINTVTQGLSIAVLIPLGIWWSMSDGAMGLAYAYLAAVPVTIVLMVFFAVRLLEMTIASLIAVIWRPAVASAVMFYSVRLVFPPTEPVPESFIALVGAAFGAIIVGATAFAGTTGLLWHLSGRPGGAERTIVDRGAAWIGARRKSA